MKARQWLIILFCSAAIHAGLLFAIAQLEPPSKEVPAEGSIIVLRTVTKGISPPTGGGETPSARDTESDTSGEVADAAPTTSRSAKGPTVPRASVERKAAAGAGRKTASAEQARVTTPKDIQLDLLPSVPAPAVLPKDAPREPERPEHRLQPKAGGRYVFEDTQFDAEIDYNGDVDIDDEYVDLRGGRGGLALGFDVTDMILRANGDDPYGYEKAKFMDATRSLRLEMKKEACRESIQAAVVQMKERLSSLWSSRTMTKKEKRALLFELWDECAEEGDETIVQSGDQIRATIVAFIQRNLPRGSPFAYTKEELELFNRRRGSKRAFAPYGT